MPNDTEQKLRCPTCGARQDPAPECRRCRCDLTLVTATLGQRKTLHAEYHEHLRAGHYTEAAQAARQIWELSPGEDAARLLAVAYLLAGRYQAAMDVYDALPK